MTSPTGANVLVMILIAFVLLVVFFNIFAVVHHKVTTGEWMIPGYFSSFLNPLSFILLALPSISYANILPSTTLYASILTLAFLMVITFIEMIVPPEYVGEW